MTEESELVVIGRVDGVARVEPEQVPVNLMPFTPEAGKNPERPTQPLTLSVNTTFGFTVERVLKGDSTTNKVLVRQASGVYERTLYLTGDDVPLVPGDRYLLFLVRSQADPSAYETTAFIGGQFPIRNGRLEAAYGSSKLAQLLDGRQEDATAAALAPFLEE